MEAHPKDFTYLEGKDPDQRALNEINSFDGPLLIADIVAKIKNIRDFAGKKKRGLAKLDPQNYEDMGPLIEVRTRRPAVPSLQYESSPGMMDPRRDAPRRSCSSSPSGGRASPRRPGRPSCCART